MSKTKVGLPGPEVYEHGLILGAPGSGKSSSLYIPNLYHLADRAQKGKKIPNIVVTDPKGELLLKTGKYFRDAGCRVWILNPLQPEASNGFNMLQNVETWDDADALALMIMVNTQDPGSGNNPIFTDNARMILALLFLHCKSVLGDQATMLHAHALGTVAEPEKMQQILESSPSELVREKAKGLFARLGINVRLLGSILPQIPIRLALWDLAAVKQVSTTAEICFDNFYKKQTILYIINPMEKHIQMKPLMSSFFRQFFQKTIEIAKKQPNTKLPRPVWLLLDEFANIGYIPGFDNFLTVCRGYDVGILIGIQSRSQLKGTYGETGAETIINSCANYFCYPRVGKSDADWIADRIGTTTVVTKGKAGGLLSTMVTQNYAAGETKRQLLTADEILNLGEKAGDEKLIVFAGRRRPVIVDQLRYYRDPTWRDRPVATWADFTRDTPFIIPATSELLQQCCCSGGHVNVNPELEDQTNDDPVDVAL